MTESISNVSKNNGTRSLITFLQNATCEICVVVCVFMQGSEVRVNFVVMRATEAQEEGGRGVRRPEPQYFRRRSAYMKVGPNMRESVSALVCFCLTHSHSV